MGLTVSTDRRAARPGGSLGGRIPKAAPLLGVSLLTAIALALRFSQAHQSLLGDEVFTYQDIHGRSFGAVLTTVHTGGENSPPLFFLLAWLAIKVGDPTVWLRLPSLILSSLTVPLVYLLGRETVGRVAGLIGAAAFAVSPFTVYYGVEGRPYATMTFFVALATLAMIRAVRTRRLRWWALYVVASDAAAYTHYTCVFVLALQGLWAMWMCRDRLRQPALANLVVAVLYAPWLPQLRGKELGVIGGLYPLSAGDVVRDWPRSLFGYVWASLTQIPATWGLVVLGLALLAGLGAVLARWWRSAPRRIDLASPLVLLVGLAVATPIGLLLYSVAVTDLWLPRGLSASIPAAMLVIGALLAALPRAVAAVAAVAVLATLVVGTFTSFGTNYVREPYRAMAAYIDAHARPRDRVISVSLIGGPAITAMMRRPLPVLQATPANVDAAPPGSDVFVVVGDEEAQKLRLHLPPRVSGIRLIVSRHYRGSLPTELYVYRRL